MFFGMVLLGLLHGLCFLPVYLAILGRWSKPVLGAMATEARVQDSGQDKELAINDIQMESHVILPSEVETIEAKKPCGQSTFEAEIKTGNLFFD